VTGIPADRIVKLAREIGTPNLPVFARAGVRSVRQMANNRPRYRDAAHSDR
jgi:hypothetical protein